MLRHICGKPGKEEIITILHDYTYVTSHRSMTHSRSNQKRLITGSYDLIITRMTPQDNDVNYFYDHPISVILAPLDS